MEVLEQRLAPTVSAIFSSGTLTVSDSGTDQIAIVNSSGFVKINSQNPNGGAVAVSAITRLTISDTGTNTIDLSQILTSNFPSLTRVAVTGVAADTLIAPNQDNTWLLQGQNTGTVSGPNSPALSFSKVANLTSNGGASTFNFSAASSGVTGTVTVGQAGAVFNVSAFSTYSFNGAIVSTGGNVTINANGVNFNGNIATGVAA